MPYLKRLLPVFVLTLLILVMFVAISGAGFGSQPETGSEVSGALSDYSLSKFFYALTLVVLLLIGLGWMARRFLQPHVRRLAKSQNIRLLESAAIAPRSRIAVAEVFGRMLVLGVTEHSISLLAELDEAEKLKLQHAQQEKANAFPFKQYLRQFL